MHTKTLIGGLLAGILIVGVGYIVYMGRPVMRQAAVPADAPAVPAVAAEAPDAPPSPVTSTESDTSIVITAPPAPTPAPTETVATKPTPTPTSDPVPTPTSFANDVAQPPTPTPAPTPKPGTYTMADVEARNTPEQCWTAIQGSVYDLSTWVSRHPGGESPIKNLCGKDGSDRFAQKHGSTQVAIAALALLKIGVLR